MSKLERRLDKARALANADERRRVVLRVLQACDDVRVRKLDQLAAAGVTPTCSAGCSHCCSLEILTSRAEGEALVEWLAANKTPDELEAIRARLRAWLGWYRNDFVELLARGISRVEAFAKHAPKCALLVDDRCGAYPVRPIVCRNHFVSSPVSECDPATTTSEPDAIFDVSRAASFHVAELRQVVERQGGDYRASVHLIGEWLSHLLDVEREPWRLHPRLDLGSG